MEERSVTVIILLSLLIRADEYINVLLLLNLFFITKNLGPFFDYYLLQIQFDLNCLPPADDDPLVPSGAGVLLILPEGDADAPGVPIPLPQGPAAPPWFLPPLTPPQTSWWPGLSAATNLK